MNRSPGLIVFVTLMAAVVGHVLGQIVPLPAFQRSWEFGRLSLALGTIFSVNLSLIISLGGAVGVVVALWLMLRR